MITADANVMLEPVVARAHVQDDAAQVDVLTYVPESWFFVLPEYVPQVTSPVVGNSHAPPVKVR